MRQIKIELIGHKFMGKAHSHALHNVSMFLPMEATPVMKTLCGLEDDLEETANRVAVQHAFLGGRHRRFRD